MRFSRIASEQNRIPSKMENVKAQQILKPSFRFQMDRSLNLLRVRSSDWYQTKALGVYFHRQTRFCFPENFAFEIETKPVDFGSDFGSISACHFESNVGLLTGWRKKSRIIENWRYHFLPSSTKQLKSQLSKYQVRTPHNEISGLGYTPNSFSFDK